MEVRAIAALKLHQLKDWLVTASAGMAEEEQARRAQAIREIEQFERDGKKLEAPGPSEPPDGPPIGSGDGLSFGAIDEEAELPGIS